MANDYDATAKNVMLDALRAVMTYVSLHNADPGAGATGELTGGSPAYARKAIAFSAATGGAIDDTTAPVFDVPAGSTVAWIAFWSAVTGGTRYAKKQVTSEVFGAQGTYTLTDVDFDLNDP